MGIASQGEGSGLGSHGHQAKGVKMGMRRVPHGGPVPAIVNPAVQPLPASTTVQNPPSQGP